MEQERIKYRVYQRKILHYNTGETEEKEKVLGETLAVSEKKAISNLKYRLGIKKPIETLYGPAITEKYYAKRVG